MQGRSLRWKPLTLCFTLLCAAFVSACGSDEPSSGGTSAAGTCATQAGAGGGAQADALQALYEEAKKDGKIVLWGGEDPADMEEIFASFSKTYPGLTLETTAVNPDQQPTKLQTAQAAGQDLPDLIQGRKEFMPPIQNLVDTSVGWAACGAPASIVSSDGGIFEINSVYVLAYNKNLVSDPSTLPTTWDALNDARWKGKVSVDPRGFPFNILAVQKGEQGILDFVRSLKSTVSPVVVQGGTAGMVQLTAGAFPIRVTLLEDVKAQEAKGAPVGYQFVEPVVSQPTLWYQLKDAKHKAAATLFAMWYTSADGGQVFQEKLAHRTNEVPDEAAGKQIVTYNSPEESALVAKVTPEIANIWSGQ